MKVSNLVPIARPDRIDRLIYSYRNLFVLLLLVLFRMSVFTVDETQQVIISEFRKPIAFVNAYEPDTFDQSITTLLETQDGRVIKEKSRAGIQFRWFWQSVHRFSKQLQTTRFAEQPFITQDQEPIIIDYFFVWRITDPLKFWETAETKEAMEARIDQIVDAELLEVIGKTNFQDVVSLKREQIMQEISLKAADQARDFGVTIVDFRIKHTDFSTDVEASVIARMVQERRQAAEEIRADGEKSAIEIRAEADKIAEILIAEGMAEAERLRGEGDAQAIVIYGDALSRNPEFYTFVRSLEAYAAILQNDDQIIIPANSVFFRFLIGEVPDLSE